MIGHVRRMRHWRATSAPLRQSSDDDPLQLALGMECHLDIANVRMTLSTARGSRAHSRDAQRSSVSSAPVSRVRPLVLPGALTPDPAPCQPRPGPAGSTHPISILPNLLRFYLGVMVRRQSLTSAWWEAIEVVIVTGAANARTEAANTSIKPIKRAAHGFPNPANYTARILLTSAARTVALTPRSAGPFATKRQDPL